MAVVVDEYGRVAGIVTVETSRGDVGRSTTRPTPGGEIRRLQRRLFVRGHGTISDLIGLGVKLQ